MSIQVMLDETRIVEFCRRWGVTELALFGSVLRDDFRPDSDVDVLVEWRPGATVGFVTLGEMAEELSAILGRCVDLVPKSGLKPRIRQEVVDSAQVIYVAA
ncbi:MAG TPA: nucleotidyltransferase family protein [Oscillatoriaceae cyanobacterium]